jgi:hypothetical protein
MDDEIKGWKIGSTYMTWVGGIGLALMIVGLGLLATASLGLWPSPGQGGLELGGILNFAPDRPVSSEIEKKRQGNAIPAAPDRSLPPATAMAWTFNASASSGNGGNGGRRGTSNGPNRPKQHESSPVAPIPAGTPPGHGGTPPGHGGTPPGHAHDHGPPPPATSGKTLRRPVRGQSGQSPPGQLKK